MSLAALSSYLPKMDLLHLIENTFDRNRIYANPSSYPNPNSKSNPNTKPNSNPYPNVKMTSFFD